MPLSHASRSVPLTALARDAAGRCRWLLLLAPLLLAMLAGCASPGAVYGEKARFSPAFQGYVMAAANGSDDPGKDDAVLLLRDPIGGNKLRCREEVVQWRELYEDVAVERLHDDRVAMAAAITSGVFFAPIVVMDPIGGLALFEALSTGTALYDSMRTANAGELLAAAIHAHKRKRFPRASLLLERALAKDGAVGTGNTAYLYLGLSYYEQGQRARARAALNAFVERAAVRDVDGYREAEATLKTMGVTRKPCASMEPVELHWQ